MEGKTVVCEDCAEVIEEDTANWTHDFRLHTGDNEALCKVCWQIRNID
jgi:hypothetical protein